MIDLDRVQYEPGTGLVPVVAQDADTGTVLMVGYANREALERTQRDGVLWFHSRSRGRLWMKGETSGNTMRVVGLALDCDGDALVALVQPAGPICHTGARACFDAAPLLVELADTLRTRGETPAADSYTGRLLADANLRIKKIGEEAAELVAAVVDGDPAAVRTEAADLLYHTLVAALGAGVQPEELLAELRARRRSLP